MARGLRQAALIIVLLLLMTFPVASFSCAQRDPRDLVREGWTIVDGVIEAESLFGIRLRVEHVYQGAAARTITILNGQANANRIGYPWTFYLQRSPLGYHDADCRGSHPGPPTGREDDAFGLGASPSPDEPLFGSIGNPAIALSAIVLVIIWRRRSHPSTT